MSTTLLEHLPPEDLDDIGRELDAIRDEVMADLGGRDASYIRKVVKRADGLFVSRRPTRTGPIRVSPDAESEVSVTAQIPVSMLIEMVPLIVLFEVSIVLASLFGQPGSRAAPSEPSPEGTG